MLYPQNLHTHGILCDGKNEYEDTIQKAIEIGFTSIGFSGHSYTPYSNGLYCMTPEGTEQYKRKIALLKECYKEKIDVFCGLEFDIYSEDTMQDYDYIIGTLHYLKLGNKFVGLDRSADAVKELIDTHFDGNGLNYVKAYYEQLARLPQYGKFDIVGHFDLVTKHSESHSFFEESSEEYKKYAKECLYTLAEKIDVFEVNTGAIARGYRTTPYPSSFLLKEIKKAKKNIIISSDCHDNNFLNYKFDNAIQLCRECGFREVQVLTKEGFKGIALD